jgi:antitoxin VapB
MIKFYKGSSVPISIKNPETEDLARKLANLTGESLTSVINAALAERYARLRRSRPGVSLHDELSAIADRCANRPIITDLTDDQILGYDQFGAPTQ